MTIVLIDLSGIVHAQYHVSASDPNPDATSIASIAKVRALASGQPHVAVCCEGGRSFRKDVSADYKANRPAHEAPLLHQMQLTVEALRADGFPIWSAKGFEADDVIGAAAAHFAAHEYGPASRGNLAAGVTVDTSTEPCDVLVCSSDKDLLQLVGPRVKVKSLRDGNELDEAAVQAKFGIAPNQVRDYLCLVGDNSDNVKGAAGIGPKRAAELLTKYGTIEDLYAALSAHGTQFTPAIATSLREFEPRLPTVRELITLRTDVPIPFEEVFRERVALDVAVFGDDMESNDEGRGAATAEQSQTAGNDVDGVVIPNTEGQPRGDEARPALSSLPAPENSPAIPPAGVRKSPDAATGENRGTSLAVVDHGAPPPAEWERQLEPRSFSQTLQLGTVLHKSRLFSAYGSPEAVASTILAGRELGITAMASLRGFHIIEGKPTMAADMIRALVMQTPECEYFRCTERTAERATFVTKRKGDPEFSLTFTIDEARAAWAKRDPKTGAIDERSFLASGWGRNPADMCVARASSKLARLVYPGQVHGFYSPEELEG